MGPGSHLIQGRLLDCLICCALYVPTSWINVQDVLPDVQEAPARKTSLQYLCWCNMSFSSMILT